MTSEQRIAEVYAAAFVSDGARITGLHNRPFIAEAHANALKAVIASVRAEAIEECLRKYRDVMSERLNLHYDQRMYGWHDLQWAMEESEKGCRALAKERKGEE